MEKKIDVKNWARGKVIFSYKCEDNTFKKTVEEAVRRGVSLASVDLSGTDLSNADLRGADLKNTALSKVNLSNANLFRANLNYTDLSYAILDNVKGLNDQCPKEGSFIGWKGCIGNDKKYYIVKLEIPEDAKRGSGTGIKCRCSKAKVLEIQNIDGIKANIDEVYSFIDFTFKYKVGEIVEVPDFDERYWIECSTGIHFFMDRIAAVNYLS